MTHAARTTRRDAGDRVPAAVRPSRGPRLWLVADSPRVGAAPHAIRIAENILERELL
ncbi:hypothetical protein [Streptomyces sp. NPDC006997]|uniref:hypothetical protein n=1 Tax=Streptomyces sp. NPDC006997 TaxID=3155356 RepID=UPI0033FD307B